MKGFLTDVNQISTHQITLIKNPGMDLMTTWYKITQPTLPDKSYQLSVFMSEEWYKRQTYLIVLLLCNLMVNQSFVLLL